MRKNGTHLKLLFMKYTYRCRYIDFTILPFKLLCLNISIPSGLPEAISRK